MKISILMLTSLFVSASAFGTGSTDHKGSTDQIPKSGESSDNGGFPYPDLHQNNRKIAFASAFLAENGSDVTKWKAIENSNFDTCKDKGGSTENEPKQKLSNGEIDPNRCSVTTYFTTGYSLQECPDGRAYINRSGEAAIMSSATEGVITYWMEMSICGPDSLGNPPADLLNPNRPLQTDHLKIVEHL